MLTKDHFDLSSFISLTVFLSICLSQVKYREKYINSLGTWKSIPDRPEFFFSRIVNDNVSNVSTVDLHSKIMHTVLKYLPIVGKGAYCIFDILCIFFKILPF